MVRGSPIVDAPPVDRALLAPQKRRSYSRWRFAARGDSLPPPPLSKLGPVIPRAPQCIPSRAAWLQIPLYQTHPQVRGRSWRLINAKVTAVGVLLPGEAHCPPPPEPTFPLNPGRSTTPTAPRNTVPDASCKDSAPVKRALLAPQKRARGGPLSDGQNALCGPYIAQGTPNQKYLSKNDRQWQSVWVAFLRFGGDLDRQRRRRVRFVQGS
jgi:hypothetical protein